MDELQQLMVDQQKDKHCYKIDPNVEGETLIRPYVYRFPNFAGETPRQKAYSTLLYFGWKIEDIHSALSITLEEIESGMFDFAVTYKPENYQQFFLDIPKETPKHKAILILRGLYWTNQDISDAVKLTKRMIIYVTACLR
jgi:hypothetical protein